MEENKQEIVKRGTNLFDVNPDNIAKNIVEIATGTDIMTSEDKKFFIKNTDRWQQVQQNCHIWRTSTEKESILFEHPTVHSKFHQAILENKVFVDETVRLAKESEIQKLEAEELYVDMEKLKQEIIKLESIRMYENSDDDAEYKIKKKNIKLRKKTIELQEKVYVIQQSSIAMKYRIAELKDWKAFEDELIQQMQTEGYSDEEIWDKNFGQTEGYFLLFLTKYQGVATGSISDGGEIHNMTYLANYAIQKAINEGKFESYLKRCNRIQLDSLKSLGYIDFKLDENSGKMDVSILFKLPK